MSAAAPTISVVMAAYNGAAFLRDTLDSVFAQTEPDFEIVVVDDCSKDDTRAVLAAIADPRLRVIAAERNGGPAVARTIAMQHARGRFIVGLDQDDLCRPERFARQLRYLDEHPDVVLVGSVIETFQGGAGVVQLRPGPFTHMTEPDQIDWAMLLVNPMSWSTVMMRGEAARALVPFERDAYRFAEDFDLYQRIRAHGRLARIPEPLLRYRLHPGGASQAFEEGMIASAAKVLADRHGSLFGEQAVEAAELMSRYASARHAPRDTATLSRCGQVIERLLAEHGHIAPGYAEVHASRLWWRMARAGLRAGHYGITGPLRVQPAFSRVRDAQGRAFVDAAVGVARRIGWKG